MDKRILVVDDELSILTTLRDDLKRAGYFVDTAESICSAEQMLVIYEYFCIITDIRLPDGDGLAFMSRIKKMFPDTNAVIITAYGSIESAVSAMKQGADDFVVKPFYNEQMVCILQKLSEVDLLKQENKKLRQQVNHQKQVSDIIGKSRKMQEIFTLINTVAQTDASILITGESGTGKELIATAIHQISPRCNKPLIKMNCSVFTPSLLEDELFGHEKGAFTGAVARKAGRFEIADKGTIFLDDIDDLDRNTQVKLLRVLQEREFERVGGTQTIKVDVRIITASKTDLRQSVQNGLFREDLFYRLNVVPILLPPLRERKEDIPLLIDYFLSKSGKNANIRFDPLTLNRMLAYDWPGNIRELENTIEGALAMAGDVSVLSVISLPEQRNYSVDTELICSESTELSNLIKSCEKEHIIRVLKQVNGNKTEASKQLGISRKSLWQKIKGLGINV